MASAEFVYAVIRYCSGTGYQKTLLLANQSFGEIPTLRLNYQERNSSQSRRQMVTEIINNLVENEFNSLTFKSIRRIATLGREKVKIFLVEYEGWPEEKTGCRSYFFTDNTQIMQHANHLTRRIIAITDTMLSRVAEKIALKAKPESSIL